MNHKIRQEKKRTVTGFHLVSPREQTVKKGFGQLMMWVDSKNIMPKEWVAVYYDNPDKTPAKKLHYNTVVTVPGYFTPPENSEGVIPAETTGGQYAVAVAHVVSDDFVKPWYQFLNSLLQDGVYEMLPKPCSEVYLDNSAKDGYWDIGMYVAAQPKHHQFTSRRCVNVMTTPFFESEKSKVCLSIFLLLPGNYTVPGLFVG